MLGTLRREPLMCRIMLNMGWVNQCDQYVHIK